MKKAIEFLRSKGIEVDETGLITGNLPEGEDGFDLIEQLEEATMTTDEVDLFCYQIIINKLTIVKL